MRLRCALNHILTSESSHFLKQTDPRSYLGNMICGQYITQPPVARMRIALICKTVDLVWGVRKASGVTVAED